jgi:inosose dehydratase
MTEMRQAGLTATELGPDGFLPADTAELTAFLDGFGLSCVGGFVPVILHDAAHDPAQDLAGPLESLVAANADVVVLAAATGTDGYDARPELDDVQWATLLGNLDRLAGIAADRGLKAVLHPHVGTMVETRADVDRVLAGSAIPLCLDTGHLLIGGTDPLQLTLQVPERIEHAHLKDVNAALAQKVQRGELTYTQAVAAGLYVPLGAGDVDIAGIVKTLEDGGYTGWYVMEQDNILAGEPDGDGPLSEVLASVRFLQGIS